MFNLVTVITHACRSPRLKLIPASVICSKGSKQKFSVSVLGYVRNCIMQMAHMRLMVNKLIDVILCKVKREVAEAIKSAKTPPSIIPYNPQEKGDDDDKSNWTEDIVDALLGVRDPEEFLNKKKDKHKKQKGKDKKSKSKAFNFYSGKPDVHNCYGWSRTMTNKDLDAMHGSNIGMFMVNLTTVMTEARG